MKKLLLPALALAALVAAPSFAQAAKQDVAKIPCSELTKMNATDMGMMLMWIDGYMSAEAENTEIDDEWMAKLGKHMGSYCAANPNATVMQAMEAMPEE